MDHCIRTVPEALNPKPETLKWIIILEEPLSGNEEGISFSTKP